MFNNYYDDYSEEERPAVWKGMLSNFCMEKLIKVREAVEAWNSVCSDADRLVIKTDAYDIKGRLLKNRFALHREDPEVYSDLSGFWNIYNQHS